ncbi:MAG: co-chaperone GroES [Bdellovibrionaceae bacterium]|nr:co-chaperone GroES [Pseudobdellovibrionaceae bacterium]
MAKKKKMVKKPVKKAANQSAAKKSIKQGVKKAASKKVTPKKKTPVKAKTSVKAKTKVAVKKVVKPTAKPLVIQKQTPKNIDYAKAVTPLGERLVVRAVQAETMTAGGLYIPDTVDTRERYVKATVLATGNGAKNKKGHTKPLDVKVGDTILFPAYASVRIQFNSEELHIVNESDVLGTV